MHLRSNDCNAYPETDIFKSMLCVGCALAGSPLVSEWAFSTASAVLNIGYGGQAAGYGLVDVLLNEPEGPSGKLTVTYYKDEQLGSIVDYGMRASYGPTGKTYKFLTAEPHYRFGYGLTCTSLWWPTHC